MNAVVDKSINPFGTAMSAAKATNAIAEAEQQRAIAETQAAMVIAKKFPRDPREAMDRILQACTRQGLAESAMYSYARGGTDVTGPSIRLAEAIAQEWGNLQYGIRELSQANGESTVEAFAWDIERNTRQVKVFQVPHVRYTKQGSKRLEDPRDIYELIANQGARRLRACILGIIPGDVVDAAVQQSEMTMKSKAQVTPERLKSLLEKFEEFGVSKEMIEKRIQRRIDAMTPALMVNLGKIFNSLKDGMSKSADWFEGAVAGEEKTTTQAESIKEKLRTNTAKKPAPAQPQQDNGLPAYADLKKSIQEITDVDALDLIVDHVRDLEDQAQKDELNALYLDRRKQLAKK